MPTDRPCLPASMRWAAASPRYVTPCRDPPMTAGYYPGAGQLDLKLLFAPEVGRGSALSDKYLRPWCHVSLQSSAGPALGVAGLSRHQPACALRSPTAERQGLGVPGHRAGAWRGETRGRCVHVHAGGGAAAGGVVIGGSKGRAQQAGSTQAAQVSVPDQRAACLSTAC